MTITYSQLGRMGRLGNQMFQYAALRGIAEYHGYDWVIPPSTGQNEFSDHRLFQIFEMFSVTPENVGFCEVQHRLEESRHNFDAKLFFECPDETDINGYLQSPYYFQFIEDIIRSDFTVKSHIKNETKSWMNSLPQGEKVSVHIRRTDYLNLQPYHPLTKLDYYEAAMSIFPGAFFIVLSDDLEWCKQQSLFQNEKIIFPPLSSQAFDFCLMTECDGNIICNSSYSWWGAWLNGNNRVVVPSTWFGEALAHKDTSDYYLPEWTKI